MPKLLIIDGNAVMHRSFHAYPPFTDKNEAPIGAVYGFFAMLLKVLATIDPQYLIICFDRPKPTFRKNMYAGYQAKRPKMNDDLSLQMKTVHAAINLIQVPIFEIDGYEADDLIGTLSVQAVNHVDNCDRLEVIVFSGDRDLLQLVNSQVKILAPITGMTKFIIFDEKTVLEKFNILPKQIIDYKALVGDGSDGYPGVTGIGPKTAGELINKYQTLENIYKKLGEINPKIANKLANDAEQAILCKKLATIILDAPVHLNLNQGNLKNFTTEKFTRMFEIYGFNSLKNRLSFFKKSENIPEKKSKLKSLKNENQMSLI